MNICLSLRLANYLTENQITELRGLERDAACYRNVVSKLGWAYTGGILKNVKALKDRLAQAEEKALHPLKVVETTDSKQETARLAEALYVAHAVQHGLWNQSGQYLNPCHAFLCAEAFMAEKRNRAEAPK